MAARLLLDESALLAILSGISWGASAIVVKRRYARYPGVDLLALTTWEMVYGALVMSAVAWLVPQYQPGFSGHWYFGHCEALTAISMKKRVARVQSA